MESMVCAPKMTCWLLICALRWRMESKKTRGSVPSSHHYGRSRRSHGHKIVWHLQAGDVEVRAKRLPIVGAQTPLLDMPDHADDLRQLVEKLQVDTFADGVLVGEIFLGEDFIDHDDERRVLVVLKSKEPAAQQGEYPWPSDNRVRRCSRSPSSYRSRLPVSAAPQARRAARHRRSGVPRPRSEKPPGHPERRRACRRKSRKAARIASGFAAIIEGGSESPNVSTWCGSKPGSTLHSFARLRMVNPAPISRTRASAISTTTNTLCARWRVPLAPRPPCLSSSWRSGCEVFSAGVRPKRTPASREMAAVKTSTRASSPTCSARGRAAGSIRSAARVPHAARSKLSAPPARASPALSVSS